jgi:hypothetical protein
MNWMVARSKVFAVRCADDIWQSSVWHMVQVCDIILVDVSEMTGNLAWELDLLRTFERLDDCMFIALRGHEVPAGIAVARQLGSGVRVWKFDRSGQLEARGEFQDALASRLLGRAIKSNHSSSRP